MFPEIPESSLAAFVAEFPDRPVSFWGDVRAAIWEETLGHWSKNQQPGMVMSLIRENRRVSLADVPVTANQVLAMARSMVSRDIRNFSYLTV